MKHNLKAVLAGMAVIAAIVSFFALRGGTSSSRDHAYIKADTSRTWLKYFNSIGVKNTDTETYVIRIIHDSLYRFKKTDTIDTGEIISKDSLWVRDTLYYVPYDTTVVVPNHQDSISHKADTSFAKQWTGKKTITMWVYLPYAWVIHDYNKSVKLGQK